jgi:GNAT superfamily N-acetyltransferase
LPEHRLLVAEYNGVVVGTLFVLVVANLSHGARPWAILENMIVDGNYRNKGIGHMLIDFALDFCRDAGCYKAQLLSNVKRDNAHRFYRSAGFQDSALGFRRYLP